MTRIPRAAGVARLLAGAICVVAVLEFAKGECFIELGEKAARAAADTLFGPLYVAWGHTTCGDPSWYLLLDRP